MFQLWLYLPQTSLGKLFARARERKIILPRWMTASGLKTDIINLKTFHRYQSASSRVMYPTIPGGSFLKPCWQTTQQAVLTGRSAQALISLFHQGWSWSKKPIFKHKLYNDKKEKKNTWIWESETRRRPNESLLDAGTRQVRYAHRKQPNSPMTIATMNATTDNFRLVL